MKIGVVGAGGLGGYFGGRLAMAGEDVRFLARGAHLEALRAHGLRVTSTLGDFALDPAATHATDDAREIGPVDVVLFTVKSYDTESAAALLPPLIGPGTQVVSLQNGIDNEDRLAARIGREHVAGGVAYIFAGIAQPGLISHTGGPARIQFGALDGRRPAGLQALLDACRRAGIVAELTDDIRAALWTKYVFICAQAGITSATRQPIDVIRGVPRTWDLFRQVLAEGAAVARAEGVALPDDLVERHLAFAASLEPGTYSSLYADMVAGRRMELEALLGELVRRAEAAGVSAPASSALYAILLPEALARGGAPGSASR